MQQKPDLTPKPLSQGETERELYSDKKAAFLDALECLYVVNNQSARSLFREKWPEVAEIIFDPELIRYDYEGVSNEEERSRRATLEIQADEKREELLAVFNNMEANLVVYGSLQIEALEKLMSKISRPIAQYIFAERFVNRYFPRDDAGGSEAVDTGEPQNASAPGSYAIRNNSSSSAAKPPSHMASNAPVRAKITASMPSNAVPESLLDSIGHIDHSYKAGTPHYKDTVDGEEDEDMRWLSMSVEEDEFGDVKPITVGEQQPQSAPIRPADVTPLHENHENVDTVVPERVSAPINPNAHRTPDDGRGAIVEANPLPDNPPSVSEPAERVPRLEDLDKHVPPIPGSDDSSDRY